MKKDEFIIILQNKNCIYSSLLIPPLLLLNSFYSRGSPWGEVEVKVGMEEVMEGMSR